MDETTGTTQEWHGGEASSNGMGDGALRTFEAERRRLFGVAYRMLGSVADAEDVLQDAWLRWQRLGPGERSRIERPDAYLVRLVARLCIDALRAVRARRMEYVGPWLPEPLTGDAARDALPDPAARHERADDLSLAFLLMLERLSPVERAVLVLRESFDFSYRDIASIVGRSEVNCRQIERRARQRIADEPRAPRPVDHATHARMLRNFLDAAREGDVDGLVAMLADDVVSRADSGGRAPAARRPVSGALNVARYLVGLARLGGPDAVFRIDDVNGAPAIFTFLDGRLHSILALHIVDHRIRSIFIVVNPDKLPAVTP